MDTIIIGKWSGALGKGLAPRELEATLWAAADLTVKQIGRAMGISPATAEKRLESARFKLGVKTMRGLVLECFKRGLITSTAKAPSSPDPRQHGQESEDGVFIA